MQQAWALWHPASTPQQLQQQSDSSLLHRPQQQQHHQQAHWQSCCLCSPCTYHCQHPSAGCGQWSILWRVLLLVVLAAAVLMQLAVPQVLPPQQCTAVLLCS
jgi:hypothetical protein